MTSAPVEPERAGTRFGDRTSRLPCAAVARALAVAGVILLAWVLAPGAARGGGPLVVRSITGTGLAFPGTVAVYTDLGGFGPTLTHAQADGWVVYAYDQWKNVASATFDYQIVGDMSALGLPDITAANADTIIGVFNGGDVHLIYDDDGTILSDFFGAPPGVLGLSTPEYRLGLSLAESYVVLNGTAVDPADVSGDYFAGVFTHETGHSLNLAHAQANGAIYVLSDDTGPDGCSTPYTGTPGPGDLETMYPFINPVFGGDGIDVSTVDVLDDIATLSDLYPAGGWPTSFGTISGFVYGPGGLTEATGVNLIARNVADPFGDCISTMSGELTQGERGPDGEYEITGLSPGANYVLYLDGIVAGGFATPAASIPPFAEEYYNGASEDWDPGVDDRCQSTLLAPTAGSVLTADLFVNEPYLPINDDGWIQVPLPFAFPFCGQVHTTAFVNGNGFVTFGAQSVDATPTVGELLVASARISALWTDLDPGGGEITAEEIGGEFVIRYQTVPEAGTYNVNTFSIVLRPDGSFALEYDRVDAVTGMIVGRSPGNGAPDPGESDLSALGQPVSGETVYEFFDGDAFDLAYQTLEFGPCSPLSSCLAVSTPGDTAGASGPLTLQDLFVINCGSGPDTVTITVDESAGWCPPPAPVQQVLAAGDSAEVVVSCAIPPGACAPDSTVLTVTAQSVGTGEVAFAQIVVRAAAPCVCVATGAPGAASGGAGDSLYVSGLWASNCGSAPDSIRVSVYETRGWCSTPAPSIHVLDPGDTAWVGVSCGIPPGSCPPDSTELILVAESMTTGWADTSRTAVRVAGAAPVAMSQSLTVPGTGVGCAVNVGPAAIDAGSFDPDGDPLLLQLVPPGPYSAGITPVLLIATDPCGISDTSQAEITVECVMRCLEMSEGGELLAVAGDTVSVPDLCVTNCGSHKDRVRVSIEDSAGWFPALLPTFPQAIAAGGTLCWPAVGVVPEGACGNDSTVVTLIAESAVPGIADTIRTVIRVSNVTPEVLCPPLLFVARGDSVTVAGLGIVNCGGQADSVVIEVFDSAGWCSGPGVSVAGVPAGDTLLVSPACWIPAEACPPDSTEISLVVTSLLTGRADSCRAILRVKNAAPVAQGQNLTLFGGEPGCAVNVPPEAFDAGTFDPDGDSLSLTLVPPGPYPAGTTPLLLIATDPCGLGDTAQVEISVECVEACLTAVCNSADLTVGAGDTVSVTDLCVVNCGTHPDRVRVSIEDSAGWFPALLPTFPRTIAPGDTACWSAVGVVPGPACAPDSTVLTLIARSETRGVSDTCRVVIRVTCPLGPRTEIDPASIVFSGLAFGDTACREVTIRNAGDLPLQVDSVTGCDSGDFFVDTGELAGSVAAGDSTRFRVCVVPTRAGPDSCTVAIATSDTTALIAVRHGTVIAVPGDRPPPPAVALLPSVPNPFLGSTELRFDLPRELRVRLRVYDSQGRLIRRLVDGDVHPPGSHRVRWDGRNGRGSPSAGGIYFIRLDAGGVTRVVRTVRIR